MHYFGKRLQKYIIYLWPSWRKSPQIRSFGSLEDIQSVSTIGRKTLDEKHLLAMLWQQYFDNGLAFCSQQNRDESPSINPVRVSQWKY